MYARMLYLYSKVSGRSKKENKEDASTGRRIALANSENSKAESKTKMAFGSFTAEPFARLLWTKPPQCRLPVSHSSPQAERAPWAARLEQEQRSKHPAKTD